MRVKRDSRSLYKLDHSLHNLRSLAAPLSRNSSAHRLGRGKQGRANGSRRRLRPTFGPQKISCCRRDSLEGQNRSEGEGPSQILPMETEGGSLATQQASSRGHAHSSPQRKSVEAKHQERMNSAAFWLLGLLNNSGNVTTPFREEEEKSPGFLIDNQPRPKLPIVWA